MFPQQYSLVTEMCTVLCRKYLKPTRRRRKDATDFTAYVGYTAASHTASVGRPVMLPEKRNNSCLGMVQPKSVLLKGYTLHWQEMSGSEVWPFSNKKDNYKA
jgi:hypothetical protein